MKKILFYEKFISPGHRSYILETIENHWRSKIYQAYFLCHNNPKENSLEAIVEFNKKIKISHCHLLTFHDCADDFRDQSLMDIWRQTGITLSATHYEFSSLRFAGLARLLKYPLRYYSQIDKLILRLIKNSTIKALTIPDERAETFFYYPFVPNIYYLPDFISFPIRKIDRKTACLKIGIPGMGRINFLIFGHMYQYKGLGVLADSLKFIGTNRNLNIIVAGENFDRTVIHSDKENIKVFKFDHYINVDDAANLFSAADCLLLPFVKGFKKSSGTYALACSYGKFIITGNEGVLAWRTKKYRTGYLCEPGNARSLAAAIDRFAGDFDRLSFPNPGSVAYASFCTVDYYLRQLEDIFNRITKD